MSDAARYAALCADMLAVAVKEAAYHGRDRPRALAANRARRWLRGDEGPPDGRAFTLTAAACCAACDVDERWLREQLGDLADRPLPAGTPGKKQRAA